MFDKIFWVMKMKKLLLCILSLMLCLNTSVIHAKEPESLMIVAHPDDETIWGGSHLINGNYTVLCITNGNNKKRKKEFMNVMEKTHSKGIILSFPDKTNQLVYFGKYASKKNKAELENEKKLSKKDYKEKLDVIQLYSSQSKVMDHLHHILPYENWKPYSNWGKIE